MNEAVSQVLVDRAREAEGIGRMVGVSFVAHVAIAAAVVLLPGGWLVPESGNATAPLMISLGGVEGPDTGGLTQLSGRTAQALREPTAKPMPEPPPMAKAPEMVVPSIAKPTPPRPPAKPVEKPAPRSASRTPTTGAEVKTGAAKVDTGAPPTPWGGLSSGGGGGGDMRTDYANFCCPEYLRTMREIIRRNWRRDQGAAGTTHMKFTVDRQGRITSIEVEKSSGQSLLDLASQRALTISQLPPLPREFTPPTLTVYLAFEYQR